MEAEARERVNVDPAPRESPSIERLIRWGVVGAALVLGLTAIISTLGVRFPIEQIVALNDWWLRKIGNTSGGRDAITVFRLQVLSAGFALGAMTCYYRTRGRSDE